MFNLVKIFYKFKLFIFLLNINIFAITNLDQSFIIDFNLTHLFDKKHVYESLSLCLDDVSNILNNHSNQDNLINKDLSVTESESLSYESSTVSSCTNNEEKLANKDSTVSNNINNQHTETQNYNKIDSLNSSDSKTQSLDCKSTVSTHDNNQTANSHDSKTQSLDDNSTVSSYPKKTSKLKAEAEKISEIMKILYSLAIPNSKKYYLTEDPSSKQPIFIFQKTITINNNNTLYMFDKYDDFYGYNFENFIFYSKNDKLTLERQIIINHFVSIRKRLLILFIANKLYEESSNWENLLKQDSEFDFQKYADEYLNFIRFNALLKYSQALSLSLFTGTFHSIKRLY